MKFQTKVSSPTRGHIAYDTVTMPPFALSHGSGGSTPGMVLLQYTVINVARNMQMPESKAAQNLSATAYINALMSSSKYDDGLKFRR